MVRLVDAEVEACSAGSVTRVSGVCEQRRGARERDNGTRERGTATVMAVALTAFALVLMGAVGFAGRSALILSLIHI